MTSASFANGDDIFMHDNVRWSQLNYQASALFLTAETAVKLYKVTETEALQQIVQFEASDLLLPEDNLFRLSLFTDEFGKKTSYHVWFNSNGRALQRTRITRGDKNQIKVTRYAQCGYYRLRKKFSDDSFNASYINWSNVKKKYKAYPQASCGGDMVVIDSNALLYLVSALDFTNVGDRRELYLESRGKPVKVRLVVKKKTRISANYKISSSTGKNKVDEKVEVLKVQLTPVVNNKKDKDSVKLLGLHGKVYLFVDVANHLILRINGDTKYIDDIDANLTRAQLQ